MCKFKSGIILKNKVVLAPKENENHSKLLESLGIEDTRENAMRRFVRAELYPLDENKMSDVKNWKFNVDQDIIPEWFSTDPERYEEDFRNAVADYMQEYKEKYQIVEICGFFWIPIKRDGNRIYYLMLDKYTNSIFGENNNYAFSKIRELLNHSDLANGLKTEFGEKLVPIKTDLFSLDGLDDYGIVEGDVLAILTLDLYRECRKKIPKLGNGWWLATPDSTPSGYGSHGVQYVGSCGSVDFGWCDNFGTVRPFFIVES